MIKDPPNLIGTLQQQYQLNSKPALEYIHGLNSHESRNTVIIIRDRAWTPMDKAEADIKNYSNLL